MKDKNGAEFIADAGRQNLSVGPTVRVSQRGVDSRVHSGDSVCGLLPPARRNRRPPARNILFRYITFSSCGIWRHAYIINTPLRWLQCRAATAGTSTLRAPAGIASHCDVRASLNAIQRLLIISSNSYRSANFLRLHGKNRRIALAYKNRAVRPYRIAAGLLM